MTDKFLSLITEFVNDALASINNESDYVKVLCNLFDKLFLDYKIFIARDYNFTYRIAYISERQSIQKGTDIAWDLPSLSHKFIFDNVLLKDSKIYISTVLFKSFSMMSICEIKDIVSNSCPIQYRYLMCINSKNTLLAMISFSYLRDTFSKDQLKLLRGCLSNSFETYHLYRDFDIKINEFMKLKDSTEMIIESIDLGIIVIEFQNKLRAINKRALKLLEIKRSITDCELTLIFKDCFNDNILNIVEYNLKASEDTIKLFDREYRRGENIKRVDMVISPYKDINNRLTGYIIILDDITERKKYEEKLLRQEKLASLGQVIAGVAHEINTPLAGIRSYSELLRESINNEDLSESSDLVGKIIKQVDRCSTIIDELLSFARKKKANKTYFNLNALITDVISISDTIRKGKEINFDLISRDKDTVIYGDRGKLEQVFLNIILNARDAIGDRGNIIVLINENKNTINIIFKDNGRGIPGEDLSRIFDPFFTTKKNQGTGLGLSLSYGVIKDHDGDIKVKSKLKEGTEFIVSLPKP